MWASTGRHRKPHQGHGISDPPWVQLHVAAIMVPSRDNLNNCQSNTTPAVAIKTIAAVVVAISMNCDHGGRN